VSHPCIDLAGQKAAVQWSVEVWPLRQ